MSVSERVFRSLQDAGLSDQSIERIFAYSKAAMSVQTFSKAWGTKHSTGRGNALGLAKLENFEPSHYRAACKVFGLTHYETFLGRLGLSLDNDASPEIVQAFAHQAIRGLASFENPTIFFVPTDLMHHKLANRTKSEMIASLEHKPFMNNCVYVTGLYDLKEARRGYFQRIRRDVDVDMGLMKSIMALTTP